MDRTQYVRELCVAYDLNHVCECGDPIRTSGRTDLKKFAGRSSRSCHECLQTEQREKDAQEAAEIRDGLHTYSVAQMWFIRWPGMRRHCPDAPTTASRVPLQGGSPHRGSLGKPMKGSPSHHA